MKKSTLLLLLTLASFSFAQTFSQFPLSHYLNKHTKGAEVKAWMKFYALALANPEDELYTSKNGIEFFAVENQVAEIQIFAENEEVGAFKSTLPYGLKWNMNYDQVIAILGEPKSGSKIENDGIWVYKNHLMRLTFDNKVLSDIVFTAF